MTLKYDSFSVKEFMAKFRPSGYGSIQVCNEKPILFTDILCDLCNAEIIEDPEDPDKKIIHVMDTYALCGDCLDAVKRDHKKNMQDPEYAAEYYAEQNREGSGK